MRSVSNMIRSAALGAAVVALVLGVPQVRAGGPVVSPGFTLPGDLASDAAAGVQSSPRIALGGDRYLAVWTDARAAVLTFDSGDQSSTDIFAARLAADGTLLDAIPLVISHDLGTETDARVAWNGTDWLVAWKGQVPSEFFYQQAVLAVRVSSDGVVLDDEPLVMFTSSSSVNWALTSNGSEWLIVAQGTQAGDGGIQARRIASDGAIIDAVPVELVPSTFFLYFGLGVHAASGEFLLTYDANGLKARRFDADLNPIGTVFDVVGNTIASNGTEYYVAWTSGTNHVGSPMAPDGTLDFPTGRLITSTTGVSNGIDVTWGGTQWWAAWERINEGYRATRISAAGLVLDPSGVRLNVSDANLTDQLALAGGDDGSLQLAWQDRRVGSGEYDIYGAHVDADVNPSAEQILSFAAPTQLGVDLAAGADGAWMAVWRSAHSGAARILAQRVGPDGTPLDALPIELDAAPALGYPSVAWDGARYLAVWSTTGGIVGRRLGADGAILDASPFDVMPGGTAEVAGLDGRFLVVGSHAPGNPQFRFAYGRRVDGATGALLDPAAMLIGPNFAQIPNVTTFDGRWLMTWQRNFTHDDVQASTEAAFVEYDGTVGPVIVVSIYGFRPQVAGGDGAALFVYGSNSPANANSDVLGRRLLPDGSMTPAFTVSSGFGKQFAPVVTWTGAEFIAAWEDRRNQNVFFDARTDIYATRIDAGGTVVDPSAFMLAERVAILPALASSGGHTLFLCSDFVPEAPYASYRIGGAIVNPGPGADLDGDGAVNASDLAILLSAWGTGADAPDLDGNGIVDAADLGLLLAAWTG